MLSTIRIDEGRPVVPVTPAITVPILSTIRINNSRTIIPMKLPITVPMLGTLRGDQSRPVITVKLPIPVSEDVSAALKLTPGFKDRLNKPI